MSSLSKKSLKIAASIMKGLGETFSREEFLLNNRNRNKGDRLCGAAISLCLGRFKTNEEGKYIKSSFEAPIHKEVATTKAPSTPALMSELTQKIIQLTEMSEKCFRDIQLLKISFFDLSQRSMQ